MTSCFPSLPPPPPRHPRRILLFLSVLGQSNLVSGAPRNVEREPAARVSARVERGRTVEKTSGRRPGRPTLHAVKMQQHAEIMQKAVTVLCAGFSCEMSLKYSIYVLSSVPNL